MLSVLMPSLCNLVDKDYSSIKNDETEVLIQSMLQGLKGVKTPTLLQVSGIPGAGKSTYCKAHQLQNYLYISFDKIMISLQSYKEDLQNYGEVKAFTNNEMKARIIGYELLNRALTLHYNIMLEHSGTNDAHIELFKNIKSQGYQTSINFIVCNTSLAIKRAKVREKETKRHVPETLIKERADKFNFYLNQYQGIVEKINILDGANNFSLLKKI